MREPNGSCFVRSASCSRRRCSSSYARRPSSARRLRAAAALTLTALRVTRPPRESSASRSSWSAASLTAFRCRSCSSWRPGGAMSGCQRLACRRRASWMSRLSNGGSISRSRTACSMSSTCGMTRSRYLLDEALLHPPDGQPPGEEREADEHGEVVEVDRLESEDRVADELDAVVERVEVRRDLRALRQPVDREECARDEEQRRDERALDVAEVVDLGHDGRCEDAQTGEPERGDRSDERDEQHPPRRIEPEHQDRKSTRL